MFNRLIAWFDGRYSPVALAADRQPPKGLWPFVFYFVGQFRLAFLIRLGLVAIGAKGKFQMTTLKFLGLLAENGRAAALPAVIDAFGKLSAAARGAVSAEVTTAVALTSAQSKGVAAALRQALGKDPEITTRVDPALLGGIKVKVGSRLFDASLKSKLDSLKFALKRA